MKEITKSSSEEVNLQSGCIDNYQDLKPVGKGRFSTVYYTKHKSTGVSCALKKIKITVPNSDKSILTKCLKEVGLLRNLSHPNIVKYTDCFLDNETLYIVLEWAGGGDLKGIINNAKKNNVRLMGKTGERASLDEDEHTRDESREMATDIMATSTTKLNFSMLFDSLVLLLLH